MLELDGLSKRYDATVALDNLTFSVRPGEVYGFVGPNGSGKTTAMRIVIGVLEPDAGEVRWQGAPLDAATRATFGYMPEERGLYPKMTVADQVSYFAELHGLADAKAEAAARHWIARLGLSERSDDAVEKLSLGNQQRAQLAVALVHDPVVLVLDEPFSGLDPIGVDVLSEVLVGVARDRGVAVIFSSHQLELVERLCDGVAIIESGRLVDAGGVEELRRRRAGRRWRLELADGAGALAPVDGVTPAGTDLFELAPQTDPQLLLDAGRAAGEVVRFGPDEPTLTELFREEVGHDRPAAGGTS